MTALAPSAPDLPARQQDIRRAKRRATGLLCLVTVAFLVGVNAKKLDGFGPHTVAGLSTSHWGRLILRLGTSAGELVAVPVDPPIENLTPFQTEIFALTVINDRDQIGSMLEKERLALALERIPGLSAPRARTIAERYGYLWRLKETDAIVKTGTPWFAKYGLTLEDLHGVRTTEGAPLYDAVTGEQVAAVSSAGVDMAGLLENTATAPSTTADPNAVNNTDSATIEIVSPVIHPARSDARKVMRSAISWESRLRRLSLESRYSDTTGMPMSSAAVICTWSM